jgi:hypothetical protein
MEKKGINTKERMKKYKEERNLNDKRRIGRGIK